jgi:hypothetical protein
MAPPKSGSSGQFIRVTRQGQRCKERIQPETIIELEDVTTSEPESSKVFFITTMDPIITSVTEQDPVVNEEALIDRDSDVFDTEITISPISVSRSNLSDKVGRCIPFLEAVQATIVPYAVEIAFPFLNL